MTPLELNESSSSERRIVPDDVALALNQLNIATVTPAGGGGWNITNVRKVGVVTVGDHQVIIHPKVPVARLFFLMSYSADRNFWQDSNISIGSENDLINTIAAAFLHHSFRATRQGLVRGYITKEDSLPVVRGRINIPAQIGKLGGLAFPAQVIFDEFTVDIRENQLLLTAARHLLKAPMLSARSRTGLHKLIQSFEGVSTLADEAPLTRVQTTRNNNRYREAIALAEIILKNSSLEVRLGKVTATAFIFDMWKIFEDFVTKALAQELERFGGSVALQATGTYLDIGSTVAIRPDLLWHSSGRPVAVVDAKYKAVKSERYPNADLYQMLAYCLRLNLRDGHLVYAKGEEANSGIYDIAGHPVSIRCHSIDLNQHHTVLLRQMSSVAETIAAGRILT